MAVEPASSGRNSGICREQGFWGGRVSSSRRPGAPSKLTPAVRDELVAGVRSGATYEACAEAVGVAGRTFRRWLERGEDAEAMVEERGECPRLERPYLDLWQRVREARAAAEIEAVETVKAAARSDWKAAAWYLERVNPEAYGSPRRSPGGRPRGSVSAPDRKARPGVTAAGGRGGEPPRLTRPGGEAA